MSDAESVERISVLVHKLQADTQTVLAFFLKFMSQVASHEDENKMGTKNLGVVFGSILLGSAVLSFSLGLKTTLERQNKVVQLMIENCDVLFPDKKFALFSSGESAEKEETEEELE